MRRGFSVFTPMVGTLVILITMLIVSSIITSERIAVQGTVKSYHSSEMVNFAAEVQARMIEETRGAVISNLGDMRGNRPVMSVYIPGCPNREVAGEFYGDEWICDENIFSETETVALNELRSELLGSSIKSVIERVGDKYDLTQVQALDIGDQARSIIGELKFIDCDHDDDADQCGDGRVEITIDFSQLKDVPVAEIVSSEKRMKVYLPDETRRYTTPEPYGQYLKLAADTFEGFRILDNHWHGAADRAHHPSVQWNYDSTDGSEWYHYRYAEHLRVPTEKGETTAALQTPITTNISFGFNSTGAYSGIGSANNAVAYFDRGDTLVDYVRDRMNNAPGWPRDVLKWNNANSDLKAFTSGYITREQLPGAEKISGVGAGSDPNPAAYEQFFLGGSAAGDQWGGVNCLAVVENNIGSETAGELSNFIIPAAYPLAPSAESPVMVDTTGNYDQKFEQGMVHLLKDMRDRLNGNRPASQQIRSGLGFVGDSVEFRIEVESKQYYASALGFSGGTNYECGYYMSLYQPFIGARSNENCEGKRNLLGSDLFFLSQPLPFTCDAKTLYRVEENYRLYRNTPAAPDSIDKVVFAVNFARAKEDYEDGGHFLWDKPGTSFSMGDSNSDGVVDSRDTETDSIRFCTYEYDTFGQALAKDCAWVSDTA